MECVVTGAAGFIGSHLCERLLREGNRVVGIDCLTPYYSRRVKEQNLAALRAFRWFEFREADLAEGGLAELARDADWVFHLAGMPGLVKSWTDYDLYHRHNILATQRLLEALKDAPGVRRLVFASTSSVYGRFATGDESLPTRPVSPYGVTKLAAENLCRAYAEEFGVPVVALRYFSVYGPRQRPDMAYHRFIRNVLAGEPIPVHDDGRQLRGNTYVTDCVEATVLAVGAEPGSVFNVGGGESVSVLDVIATLERLTGRRAEVRHLPPRKGDQRATFADVTKLARQFGWRPRVGIEEGLARQLAWQSESMQKAAA